MSLISLTPLDLSLAAGLVLLLAFLTHRMRLGLSKQIIIAALRTSVQLLLIGLVLKTIFANSAFVWIAIISSIMLLAAGREVMARQRRYFKGIWGFGVGVTSMFISSFAVTIFALNVIIHSDPWYHPQYAIPVLGMLLGNTMNGISLAMNQLLQNAWQQKEVIESRLMLGQTARESISDIRRESMRSGMIPILNAMAAAGLVSLPGMMTGQILASSPPTEAVKYQILIMFLIVVGTGLGTIAAIGLTSHRLFDKRDRLRLDRLKIRKD